MLLKEIFLKEDDRSTAVFAWGRMNPPTIGHQKLIEKLIPKLNGFMNKFWIYKEI